MLQKGMDSIRNINMSQDGSIGVKMDIIVCHRHDPSSSAGNKKAARRKKTDLTVQYQRNS